MNKQCEDIMAMILVIVLVVVNDSNNFNDTLFAIKYIIPKEMKEAALNHVILKIIINKFIFYLLDALSKEYENWFGVNQ